MCRKEIHFPGQPCEVCGGVGGGGGGVESLGADPGAAVWPGARSLTSLSRPSPIKRGWQYGFTFLSGFSKEEMT